MFTVMDYTAQACLSLLVLIAQLIIICRFLASHVGHQVHKSVWLFTSAQYGLIVSSNIIITTKIGDKINE